MRTLILGGSHPRHLYYLNAVAHHPKVQMVGAIIQQRENMLPKPPNGTPDRDRRNWNRHFINRDKMEERYFGDLEPEFDTLNVPHGDLNTAEIARMVRQQKPDLVIIFGCEMIRDPLFSALPVDSINLHLGLSPRYRGAATLFWPFYFLEPNHAGTTFHRIVAEPDAGEILHQSRPTLKRGDTIHDVSCRAVNQATADMLRLLHRWPEWLFKEQRNTGKCFLVRDFQPAHLRMIYDVWNDKIVDAYLEGEITNKEPVLWQQV